MLRVYGRKKVVPDVTDATFDRDVLQRSHDVPVVVDFWAAWCGPCRQLTPVLESAIREREPNLDLAKLDTDANQQVAAAFRVQGIPAVKAFRDGRVVLPSEADALVATGGEDDLRRALELEPNRPDAALALARVLHERGESAAALELLANTTGSYAAEGLAARIRLEDDPVLAAAFAALDAGEQQRGLDALIAAIAATDDSDRRDDLRRAVVGVLDELGAAHPLARESRRKLASALY